MPQIVGPLRNVRVPAAALLDLALLGPLGIVVVVLILGVVLVILADRVALTLDQVRPTLRLLGRQLLARGEHAWREDLARAPLEAVEVGAVAARGQVAHSADEERAVPQGRVLAELS